VGNARTLVTHRDLQHLRTGLALEVELDVPPAGIGEGVAGNLRHGGGDAGLILGLEPQYLGNLPRPLAGEDYIRLTLQGHHEDAHTFYLTPLWAASWLPKVVPPLQRGR
jgi:hypothetical protein